LDQAELNSDPVHSIWDYIDYNEIIGTPTNIYNTPSKLKYPLYFCLVKFSYLKKKKLVSDRTKDVYPSIF